MVPKKSRYSDLLKDPNVRRWFDNVARGSVATAEVYLRRLGAICEQRRIKPGALSKMTEEALYNLMLDFVGEEERKQKAGSYIANSLKALRSWLAHNGIKVTRKVKVRGADQTPSLVDERVPTPEELRRIFLAATPRDRVSCVLMAHAGLRPEVLGSFQGTDGLRVRDLPELQVKGKNIKFRTIPTIILVRPELSKTRRQYFTFLGEEGCEYIRVYLEDRLRSGERFNPDTDIIHPKAAEKPFIRTLNIGDGIRAAIRAAGFKWRPYVLRAYFDTQLLLGESKGRITHAYRQFFMGHTGDMEARYTTNKGRLPQELVEDMREAYKRSQPFLQTIKAAPGEEDLKVAVRHQFLILSGMPPEEMKGVDLANLRDEEVLELVKKNLRGALTGNGGRQKMVQLDEVGKYIQEGWEYVATIQNDKAIIKLPD